MPKLVLAVLTCLVAVAAASYYGRFEEPAYHEYAYADNEPSNDYDYGAESYDDTPAYGYDSYDAPARRPRGGYRAFRGSSGYNRPSRYNNRAYGYGDDEGDYYGDEEEIYSPRRGSRRGENRMDHYGRSGSYGYVSKPKHHVPVIIKKKKEKKRKIIAVHSGFYIPGGTAIFGKFKDLKSCQKACELTPTCFAGDFNPWLNKCYMHSNITACVSLKAHKQITHFKKVPCNVVETPRGLITLGAASWYGLEQKGIDNLMDCIKACATAGGGIAETPNVALTTPQLCFGIDYDFGDHRCYFHVDIAICGGNADTDAIPLTPVTLYAKASSINILLCPIAPMAG